MAKLTLKIEDEVLEEYRFESDLRIGRSESNDVVVKNPTVSGKHAVVEVLDGRYILKDLNSTNGVFVNDEKVSEHELKEGDKIQIGKYFLEFGFETGEVMAASLETEDEEELAEWDEPQDFEQFTEEQEAEPETIKKEKKSKEKPEAKPRPRKSEPQIGAAAVQEGAPRWIVLYADLMSVVLVFFVLLFSMSTMDKQKYQRTVKSLQQALIGLVDPLLIQSIKEYELKKEAKPEKETKTEEDPYSQELYQINQELIRELSDSPIGDSILTSFDENGVNIKISDKAFFKSGAEGLLPSAYPALNAIAKKIRGFSYSILVEGHTDDIPISTETFRSNWDLSASRASNVVQYLINSCEIRPERLMAVGRAEFQPIAPNDTEENRAKNRRVVIKILK